MESKVNKVTQTNSEVSRIADLYSAVWGMLDYLKNNARRDYQAGIVYGLRLALDRITEAFPEIKPHVSREIRVQTSIKTKEDVKEFFNDLFREGLVIDPDEDFLDCKKPEWRVSDSALEKLNFLMLIAHLVCDQNGIDINEIARESYRLNELCKIKTKPV